MIQGLMYSYTAASPNRKANNARTSVAYCRPSSKGTRCKRSLSEGSLIQPSMGIALSRICEHENLTYGTCSYTFVECVTYRTIVKYHDLAQIRLDLTNVLDVGSISKCTVLTVVPSREILAFQLEPIDDRIGIFLDSRCKHNQIVPFTDLQDVRACQKCQMTFLHPPCGGIHRSEDVCAHSIGLALEDQG